MAYGLLLLRPVPSDEGAFAQFTKSVHFFGPYEDEIARDRAIQDVRSQIGPGNANTLLMKIEGEIVSPAEGITIAEMRRRR